MIKNKRAVGSRIFLLGLTVLTLATATHAADVYEAEDARLTGNLNVSSEAPGFSGTGYVVGFQGGSDNLWFDAVVAETTGLYDLTIGYRAPYGEKYTRLYVNGQTIGEAFFESTTSFEEVSTGKVLLNAGNNVIRLENNWGWYEIDYVKLSPAEERPPHQVDKSLINPAATIEARSLMSYLVDNYGKAVISGQEERVSGNYGEIAYIESTTGKMPALIGLDFMDYSPSRVAYGTSSTETETAIDWVDNLGGIVTFCWHWNAPKDLLDTPDARWWSGFYTYATTFDVAYAMANPDSEDYALILRDIDAIAMQLAKLQAAKVPVLWRPLHEAEGGWFWWGAKGPEPTKALWKLMYDRLTHHHGLNNLIWIWNSIDPDWYPGNEYVDIVSMDSYPGDFSYTPQSGPFEQLVDLTGHRKLIAMTENGAIPDPDLIQIYDAHWSWFCTWNGFQRSANSVQHLQEVYHHPFVLTLEDLPELGAYPLSSFAEVKALLDQAVQAEEFTSAAAAALNAKLKQAGHHDQKGHTKQSIKHLRDFQKHLRNRSLIGSAPDETVAALESYAELMIAELGR